MLLKLASLYPSDPLAAARVDEIMQFITEDVAAAALSTMSGPYEKGQMRKN